MVSCPEKIILYLKMKLFQLFLICSLLNFPLSAQEREPDIDTGAPETEKNIELHQQDIM